MIQRVLICRSNPIAPDPRVEKIARALVRGGYAVQLLGWDQTGQHPLRGELDGIPYQRRRIPLKRVRGLWNLWFELRWQISLLGWMMRNRGTFDVIHACDFDTVLPALVLKYTKGKKVVYDIFDFYADMLRFTPGAVRKIIRVVDLWAIDHADSVILADDSRRLQIMGSHPRKLEIIYNSPEDQRSSLSSLSKDQAHAQALRVAYIGNLQVERGLLELIDVLRKHPEWKLELAGFGGDETRIRSAASNLPNITWHGKVPYQQALELDAQADVILATYSPRIPNHRYSSPNKLFEAMMLGKPVIVARGSNIDRIVEAEKCGLVIPYGDVQKLEEALLYLQSNPSIRQEYGRKAREAYENTYAWKKMADRLLALYQSLTG
jgi:glycosyltransferase involved in cell wall biosynthesis